MTDAPPRDPASYSPVERLVVDIPEEYRQEATDAFLATFTVHERDDLLPYAWTSLWARPNQLMPTGQWDTWFIRGGRGYGKTRTGAEGVRRRVMSGQSRAVTIIGPTAADARDVMIEGPDSGLLAVHPPDVRPIYEPSKRLLTWPNGALGHIRSGEDPDSVRGLQSDTVWGDEPASWRHGEATWDMAMLGNRIGRAPKSIITGTPRPLPWLRALEEQPGTRVAHGSTYENLGNLAPPFIKLILDRYEGTRLGRQELHALYLDDVEGALWAMGTIEATRIARFDLTDPWRSLSLELNRIRDRLGLGIQPIPAERRAWTTLVAVDPPGETAECGIVVGAAPVKGRASEHHAVILDDMSLAGPPEVWGEQVVAAYHRHNATAVIVEANQGGDMVRSTIHNVDPGVTVTKIRAKDSKYARAEPVSVLYSKGWVHHVGFFGALESQLTTWVPTEDKSPDRLDALVHLVSALLAPVPIARARVSTPVGRRLAGR